MDMRCLSMRSHLLMGAAGDDVELLLTGQVDKLDGVARNADGEVRVFRLFGVLHAVDKLVNAEDVDVQVMGPLFEIAVHHAHERVHAI